MKLYYSYLFLLVSISTPLFSQNLVSNPSFETFLTCPTAEGQINLASPWYSSNGGTADLFSTCATANSEVSVPNNVKGGNQLPLTGNGYAGIRVFANGSNIGTEYLSAELPMALEAGKYYQVVFNVVLSEESEYAISELGLYFSPTQLIQSGGVFDDVTPQIINDNGFLTDTDQWTKISSCYLATGNEKFFTIGNFNTDANTSATQLSFSNNRNQSAYYMVDDVSILEVDYEPTLGYDSLVCQTTEHTFQIDLQDTLFSLFPEAEVSFPTDGIQLSDTILQFPIEIADGNCLFYDTTTFYEQPAVEIDLGLDTNICTNDTIALISSSEGTNLWSTGEITDTIYVSQEGLYSVIFTQKLCIIKDSIYLNVLDAPNVTLPDSTFLCGGENITLDAFSEFSVYTWQDDSKESSFNVTEEGYYVVKIENKCGIQTAESYVLFDVFDEIFFPNVITPNNDEVNDHFEIEGAENCQLELNIFNRWGAQIYHNIDYKNDWPNERLHEGTYFYSINNQSFNCEQKGWIQVMR